MYLHSNVVVWSQLMIHTCLQPDDDVHQKITYYLLVTKHTLLLKRLELILSPFTIVPVLHRVPTTTLYNHFTTTTLTPTSTMQAAVINASGGVEVLKLVHDHPKPTRSPGQVISPPVMWGTMIQQGSKSATCLCPTCP